MIPAPGSEHRVEIKEVAFGGRGVGRLEDGRVVFVPFVIAGERVRVQARREKKSYVEAELLEVEAPSPDRVEPPCPYFGRCGGCAYQHIAAHRQLEIKHQQVVDAMRRIGRVENAMVNPTTASPENYAYRNRITVHVRDGAIGFFGHHSQELIDIAHCPIAAPAVNEALGRFRAGARRADGHCTLRDDPDKVIFRQTNDGAAAELLSIVEKLASGAGNGAHLIDVYCGEGFFAKRLRDRFASVVGIERDRLAVSRAQRDAAPHEVYLCEDAGQALDRVLRDSTGETWLITDPPAEGLAPEVRRAMESHRPTWWIYVSCDPTTLARDIAALRDSFQLVSATPLDMFPQTAQIEVAALLRSNAG